MSDLVVTVRQISNYPTLPAANGTENLLVQQGGVGGPYASLAAGALVSTALNQSPLPLGVGVIPPGNADAAQIFTGNLIIGNDANLAFNAYIGAGAWRAQNNGPTGFMTFDTVSDGGFEFLAGTAPGASQPIGWSTVFGVDVSGNASLPLGTLTVARDPARYFDVATMGWVSNNTVSSFNTRKGNVTLNQTDIYGVLCLDSPIASQNYVQTAITNGLQHLLTTCPFVNRWNGRTGQVFLTLSDITCVFFQPGQQPIAPTPPVTSDDLSIANTQWVVNYLTNEIAGSGALATQAWVLANTVNSFNGRQGLVVLASQDITNAGGALLASPNFSGIPTAPTANPGQATAQLATTAFVQQAVIASTTGVASFNTRTGAIVLDPNDIFDAGGALLNSPNFTGVPTAPTAALSTATTQIATTQFVMNEVAATTAGVSTWNTRTGNVTMTTADITQAGGAPLASPAFTGTPTVPTPLGPTAATGEIANTNWVVQYVSLQTTNIVSSFNGRTGAVTLTANDISAAGALVNPSPILTGHPAAPTQPPGSNNTDIATTAYVMAAMAGLSGISVGTSPPATPGQGQGWFNMNDAQLYVWTGMQWVIAVNPPLQDLSNLPATTLHGPMILNGDATQPLNPVSLRQLQANYLPLVGGVINGTPGTLIVTNRTFAPAPAFGSTVAERLCAGEFAVNAYNDGTAVRTIAAGSAGYMSIQSGGLALAVSSPVAAGAVASLATFMLSSLTGGPNNRQNTLFTGDLNATSAVYGGNGRAYIWSDGSSASDNGFLSTVYWRYVWSTGSVGYWYNPATYPTAWMLTRASDNAFVNQWGAFISNSDVRMKRDIGPDDHGLAEILQLHPIRFRRMKKPNDPNPSTTLEDGFDAQEVRSWIPEAVVVLDDDDGPEPQGSPSEKRGPRDRSGGPMLGLNTTALVAALVNAVKELAVRLERLEGAH